MYTCKCGKSYNNVKSLNAHKRFCDKHVKKEKVVSKYKLNETLYECECTKQFIKAQSLNAHFCYCEIHNKIMNKSITKIPYGGNYDWSKGLTIEKDKRIKNRTEETKQKLHNLNIGKHHTQETKELLSELNQGRNNGYVKTKWYEIFCPTENKNVKVQGTWEFKYATFLNNNNIKWTRQNIKLKYKLFETDYWHTYYPDFYLIDTDEYVEIKGYWWKSVDGKVDDKKKMQKVKEYNQDKKIKIIETLNF